MDGGKLSSVLVSNVLNEEKKQQVIALGRLGWSLRRIEEATGVRRETASSYLKEAGVALRPPHGRRVHSKPASPEKVTTDFGAESGGIPAQAPEPRPGRSPSASACEPYREVIELALSHGRNAMAIWQELVDTCGFAAEYKSVNRFVRKLRGSQSPEACAVIETAPGEELQNRLRHRPDGARPAQREVPPHAAVRADSRLQSQVRPLAGVPVQLADLGRTA